MSLALRITSILSTSAVALLAAGTAQAQSSGGSPDIRPSSQPVQTVPEGPSQGGAVTGPAVDTGGIDDIVVTARKRAQAERLQDTPITATAFSGDQLARNAAVNLQDVGRLTPGVSLQQSNQKNQQNFNIRGIGTSGSGSEVEPTVGVIQDGVFFASKSGSLGEMFDIESISILRGPQGTLFGRNVTGGAIVVETARARFENSLNASLAYSNGDTREGSLILNGEASSAIAARVAVRHRETDGLYRSDRYGRYGKDNIWLVRPSLVIKPSDRLDITIRGEYFATDGDASPVRGISPSTVSGAVVSLPQRDGYVTPTEYYTINSDRGYTRLQVYLASLQVDWDLAGGVLTSVTAYRRINNSTDGDQDGTPTLAFRTQTMGYQQQASSELRYARAFGKFLNLTTGLYYFHANFGDRFTRTLDKGASRTASYQRLTDQDSYAIFAEGDLNFTSALTLTLGGRYTKENKSAQSAPYGFCSFDFLNCRFNPEKHVSDRNFAPKVAVSYKVSPDNLLYGSITRAFRSGGFALSTAGPLLSPYGSEKVTQYEIGSKNDFLDHRLRVNGSIYQLNYTDIQRTVVSVDPTFGVTQSTFNAANAKIQGAELSIEGRPVDWLRLTGVYGYTHARYTSFLNIADPSKLRFPRVPATTGAINATITHALAGGAHIEATGGITFTGKYFYDDQNTLIQKAYNIVDATLTFRPASDRFTMSLFGKNITNTEYANWGSYLGSRGQNQFPGTPRSYGVRLGVDF
jgi:outer membrane receptor protein involved in Fe transport